MYTLVHHILYYLKLNELEDLFNEFTDFMELLNLEINLDFIEPRSFNKMSEDIKEYYDDKFLILQNYVILFLLGSKTCSNAAWEI